MVKRQKEKQYLSAREQKAQGRSRSNTSHQSDQASSGVVQKSLPFKCCALTLVPFETPVCTVSDGKATTGAGGSSGSSGSNESNKKDMKYGIVFENASLMEFVWRHKKDPVTGNPLVSSQIIKLNMDKDSETGQWQCPVLTKAFSDHNTKIVAVISPSGGNEAYVYSYEAYHELNVKPKSYLDLTTGLKFHPIKDVLILNDPANQAFQKSVRDVSNFWHIQNARKTGNSASGKSSKNDNIRKSVTATRVMEQLQKDRREKEEKERKAAEKAAKQKAAEKAASGSSDDEDERFSFEVPESDLPFSIPTEDVTGVKYTSGSAALGLTSTSSGNAASKSGVSRAATNEEILKSRFKLMASKARKGKKGYVNLVVEVRRGNRKAPLMIPLLLELHCDIVPRTCSNFLGLCSKKRYDGAIFHRLIEDFMIQGGGEKLKHRTSSKQPPKSTDSNGKTLGTKDACLWGPDGFIDEFDDRLKHTEGGGVLAMANAGPDTNKQQFYITLDRACPHLDRKHSVFGTVAKGMETFRTALMENVRTDSKDRPFLEDMDASNGETSTTNAVVVIVTTEVLEDPYKEAREQEVQRLKELHDLREAKTKKRKRMVGGGSNNSSKNENNNSDANETKPTLGVGKYLSAKAFPKKSSEKDESETSLVFSDVMLGIGTKASSSLPNLGLPAIGAIAPAKKAKAKNTKFGNFSGW
jgi:peptidyl-prolyl cis-trans isomerase-like protein 2